MKLKISAILFSVFIIFFGSDSIIAQTSRAPFIFELPETNATRYTTPVIRISAKSVPVMRFRVLEPFERDIKYGGIVITVNGEGVNRGCAKMRDAEGKVVTCLGAGDKMSGFDMRSGKNVVEIKATDDAGREFYASYVVILGDKNAVPEENDWSNGRAEKFTGKKFAVVVGVSEYQFTDAGLRSLQYADDDARAFADFLKTPAGGGFSSADIKLLVNKDATLGALRGALTDIGKRARPGDLVIVFIAGHGAPDPLASQNLYFLLADSKVVDMAGTAYPMNELKLFLDSKVKAERVISLIDTCHSAGVNQKTKSLVFGRDLVQEGDENNISNFYLTNRLFKETGRAILTSSDVNEVSQESEKWGNHGVFTWALLEGLKGKADLNSDGFITTGEVFQYTRASVQKATNFKQNPRALPGTSKDLTLAFTGVQAEE